MHVKSAHPNNAECVSAIAHDVIVELLTSSGMQRSSQRTVLRREVYRGNRMEQIKVFIAVRLCISPSIFGCDSSP